MSSEREAIEIRRQPACLRALQYRVFLPGGLSVARFLALSQELGFSYAESRGLPAIRLLDAHDNELFIVPKTGAVQLRLSYLIDRELREDVAAVLEERYNALL